MTYDELQALKQEAGACGDHELVELCDKALDGDKEALGDCRRVLYVLNNPIIINADAAYLFPEED